MQKYPVFIQDEEMACGAYCILMLLKYYGYQEEISQIKKKTRLNQNGISIKGMLECLKDYQIEAKAYEATLKDIQENVQLPCILFGIIEGIGHYVILYEIKEDEYVIGDPAKGLVSMFEDDIQDFYANRMIAIQHVGRVPELYYKPYHQFLYEIFTTYRSKMLSTIYKGFMIALLSYLSSYFYQILIDDIQQKTHIFYMIVLCVTYGIIELVKVSISRTKNKRMITLQKIIDEDCVFQTSMKLFQLPYSFFYLDKGQIQSQLTSFYQLSEISIEYFGSLFLDGCMLLVFVLGMLWIHPLLTLCVLFMFGIIVLMSYRFLKVIQQLYKSYLESHFKYQHHLLELIENQFLIRRYSLIQSTRERSYHLFLDESLSKQEQAIKMNDFQHSIQYLVYIFTIVIMILAFYLFKQEALTLGQILMFIMLMSYCMDPLLELISVFSQYKQTILIYDKYKAFEIEDGKDKDEIHEKITSIRLDNVGYSYGYQTPLFEHVDLLINHHLLLQGITGSGKSTLLKLLMGQDMNYRGQIYINDQELRDISLHSLYQHIGYVSQTPTFLHMSLFDNFLCHDKEKIKTLLKKFQCEELINMFSVILDEDGAPLSLGQRQVVSIIRMICQNYDVCLLDEAFSHMDQKLSQRVQRYLFQQEKDCLYIVVNHQTKVVKKGWDCAIMDKGKLTRKE